MVQRRSIHRSLEQLLDNTDSDNNNENFDMIFVPNATTDGYIESENDDDNDIETERLNEMVGGFYEQFFNSYNTQIVMTLKNFWKKIMFTND